MKTRFPMEKDTGADIDHLDFFADTNQRMVCVDSVETERKQDFRLRGKWADTTPLQLAGELFELKLSKKNCFGVKSSGFPKFST